MTIYANTSAGTIASGGGSVKVTLSSGVGQGNGGTSIACKGCYVQAASANTAVVKMNIGASADANTGIELGRPVVYDGTNEASAAAAQPLFVPVDDVALLYFYSTYSTAVVDITYLTG